MRGKKILCTSSIALGLILANLKNPTTTNAYWYEHPFAKLNIGYGLPEKLKNKETTKIESKKPSNAMLYSLGFGYKVNDKLSTYLDYTNFRNMDNKLTHETDTYQNKVRADLFKLNFQYNFNDNNNLSPYLTAGAGMSLNNFGKHTITNTAGVITDEVLPHKNSQFAWNVGAGINYKINKKVSLDTNYKYVNLGNIEAKYHVDENSILREQNLSGKFQLHTVNVGLTYHFN